MKTPRILLGLALVFLLFTGCESAPPEDAVLASFTAVTLDGGSFTEEDIQSKDVTIINVWATFCGPCLEEMPDLAAYAKTLPDNVQLITVCADYAGDADPVRKILQQAGYDGVTLISGDGDMAALVGSIQAVPTTVLIDSEGRLSGSPIVGGQPDLAVAFNKAVNQALKEQGKAELSGE